MDNKNRALYTGGSSSSSSYSHASVFSPGPSQSQWGFAPKSCYDNPFESSFDLVCDPGFVESLEDNRRSNLIPQLNPNDFLPLTYLNEMDSGYSNSGFACSANALLLNRSQPLIPLESSPSIGTQQSLFQKRAALSHNSAESLADFGQENNFALPIRMDGDKGMNKSSNATNDEDEMEDLSIDGSGFIYDSDEPITIQRVEENASKGGNNSGIISRVTGEDYKGKQKSLPAKNLMAERRRRKKLNDRLYILRSVVPKISKMDRASILGDAIEYLKELLQKISDLHNELDSIPPPVSSSTSGFLPLTSTLPSHLNEEICRSRNQPATVEVRVGEARAVNIHMFCGSKPGLLLSTLRALDKLGLDIQQAVISCFNGFALDVFRAEQCEEGLEILPEQIKAALLDIAGFPCMMLKEELHHKAVVCKCCL